MTPLKFCRNLWYHKTRVPSYRTALFRHPRFSSLCRTQTLEVVTDKRTDGQTHDDSIYRGSILSRGNNYTECRTISLQRLSHLLTDLALQITKRTALMAAASRGSVELCRALLSTGSSVDDVTDHVTFKQKQLVKNKEQETRAGTHAVHEAARGGHVKVLQVLVKFD